MLHGRDDEQAVITRLCDAARTGGSGVLVLRGEPGIGKTALLDQAVAVADGMRIVRADGVEHEAELPYAGLSLLLRPALGGMDALPEPQRMALSTVLGLAAGPPAEPMFVGLAVLSLLSEYAGDGPLLCVVDDAQWIDRASREALVFAARRLHAEGIVMLFAEREGFPGTEGLPELALTGLRPEQACALLDGGAPDLSATTRYRVLAEAGGNPLALLELPLAFAAEGGAAPLSDDGTPPLTGRLRDAFHTQVTGLPARTRDLLTLLAADDTGDLGVVLRAAARFDLNAADLAPAEDARLIRADTGRPAFRHPLIRAAVYRNAPVERRITAHRALAAALEREEDRDRRAWHLAAAATGPDEETATALESTAGHALARGGHLAAALAYERAAHLSTSAGDRTRRLGRAAEAALEAGRLDDARALAEEAARGTDTGSGRAALLHVQALAGFWRGDFPSAHRLLLDGAGQAAETRPEQAARMLLQATHTAWYLGEGHLADTRARLATLRLPETAALAPLVRFTVAALAGDGPAPSLADAVEEVRAAGGADVRDTVLLCGLGLMLGQDEDAYRLTLSLAAGARSRGGIGRLPTLLFFAAEAEVENRRDAALSTCDEALRIARDTGQAQWISQFSSVLAYLAAAEGDEVRCRAFADEALAGGAGGAMAAGAGWAIWALGFLDLGLGRIETALGRLEQLTVEPLRHHICAMRATPDLVESAVRLGRPERAAEPLERFTRWAARTGRPWAEALVLRCRALLAPDPDAEELWARARVLHDTGGRPMDRARTALLYGEWLRRVRRRSEAREPLRAALEEFERLGATAWAGRARAELAATGGTAPACPRDAGPLAALTPQESQIVRLAAQGLSNRDIAAQLFLSHRTVGHHLYKAYPKLGIASRGELAGVPGLHADDAG